MSPVDLLIFGAISLVASTFSGAAGAGGGFLTTPTLIFLGLAPAQAISSGKFGGLAVAIGSLIGMRQRQNRKLWRKAMPIIMLAFAIGLLAPFVIKNFDSSLYQRSLGILLLLMVPVLVYKKVGVPKKPPAKRTAAKTVFGGALLSLALGLQAIFSGGMGTLVNVVLMGMFGMSAIEANVVKRYSQLILNVTIVIGVLWSGLLVWPVIAVGITTSLCGSFIGGKLAVKKGDAFVMNAFLAAMVISGVLLVIG